MDIDVRLTDVFRSVFNDELIELRDGMTHADVRGWDSVAHISLIFALEEEFGITFSTDDLARLATIADFRQTIRRRLPQ